MPDVKWIKITTDMFDNRKIRHLRRLPDGNNIVLIWVMLLTMAGRCNSNGMIFLTENIPYTPKMLADELDFEENTVILALQALEQLSMVVTDTNGFFSISGWGEYQNIEGMEKIREQTRKRVAKHRESKKSLPCNDTRNVTVTGCNGIDIEEEKEEEKKEKVKKKSKTKTEEALDIFSSLIPEFSFSDDVKAKMLEWVMYKAEMKNFYTETGLRSLLNRIAKYCKEYSEQAVIDVVDDSMSSLYKGIIFDRLKMKAKTTPKQQQQDEEPEFLKKWSV